MTSTIYPALPVPHRSAIVTLLGWGVILLCVTALPVSFIAQLMILAGNEGTGSFELAGWLVVVAGPVAGLAAGIGLLRRKRWALTVMRVLLAVVAGACILSLFQTEKPPVVTYSPTGVKTTHLSSSGYSGISVAYGVVCGLLLVKLMTGKVRGEFAGGTGRRSADHQSRTVQSSGRNWRVGHRGRDGMFYEEWNDGAWHRLEIDGEMLTGRAHHVIYFASPQRWLQYPHWARYRRAEIIARIKSELQEPDYEYDDGPPATPDVNTPSGVPGRIPAPASPPAPLSSAARSPAKGTGALIIFIAVFLALAGWTGWLTTRGLSGGETWFPSRSISAIHIVTRDAEPEKFWFSVGLYGVISLAALGFAAWLINEGVRLWRSA